MVLWTEAVKPLLVPKRPWKREPFLSQVNFTADKPWRPKSVSELPRIREGGGNTPGKGREGGGNPPGREREGGGNTPGKGGDGAEILLCDATMCNASNKTTTSTSKLINDQGPLASCDHHFATPHPPPCVRYESINRNVTWTEVTKEGGTEGKGG